MNTVDLNRIALPINLACAAAGLLAYSYVAPIEATRQTAIVSVGAFVCSILGSIYTTRFLRAQLLSSDDSDQNPALTAKLLLGLPPIFCGFEVIALLAFGASPGEVSWLHICAAIAAGQNVEASFERE